MQLLTYYFVTVQRQTNIKMWKAEVIMIKNRTTQLIFQTIYCTLGLVGCVASLGIFDNINMIRWDFYVHFTNISNFLCLGVMLAALIQTAKKKEDGYVKTAPVLKFIGVLGILLTFLVFNIASNSTARHFQHIGTVRHTRRVHPNGFSV